MSRPVVRSTDMGWRPSLGRARVLGDQIAVSLIAIAIACGVAACGASNGRTDPRPSTVPLGAASCAGLSERQQFKAARLVFDATMLPGPTVHEGRRRVLSSPAHVRVSRYLKGHGPPVVRVQTGLMRAGSGVTVGGEGIEPTAGQRWRIYAQGSQPLATSVCLGSRPLPDVQSSTTSFSGGALHFAYPEA